MLILKYIILTVLGLTIIAITFAGLYAIWFEILPDIYKAIKEKWFNK